MKKNLLVALLLFSFVSVFSQTKIAILKPDGRSYDFLLEQRLLRKVFVNIFSAGSEPLEPTNISIKESTGKRDLQGAIFLTAEGRLGEEGQGSKVMRIYLVKGNDGILYLPLQIVGEECTNVDCTRCAFDDDSGCFCGLRTEENSHVIGCRHTIYAAENKRK